MTERIDFIEFNNVNCMYFFVTTIKSDRNVPVVKVGFTNNLFERIKSLEKQYEAKFQLIAVNHLDRLSDEKLFHKMLKLKYGDQFVYKGRKGATELYYYDHRLINEFYEYLDIEVLDSDSDSEMSDSSSDYSPSESEESSDSESDSEMSDSSSEEEPDGPAVSDNDSSNDEDMSEEDSAPLRKRKLYDDDDDLPEGQPLLKRQKVYDSGFLARMDDLF